MPRELDYGCNATRVVCILPVSKEPTPLLQVEEFGTFVPVVICLPLAIAATGDMMEVALFVPCFIDAFSPDVGVATLELLERYARFGLPLH